MTRHARVNEDQLGQYSRCVNAIADRLGKSLAFECVMAALQRIHDGQFGTGSRIICIDRSLPFDSAEFIGKDWGVIEEDERSVALTEVDLSSVRLETCLRAERYIPGETRLCRLKEAGYIRLDAKVFETLWRNQHLIPEGWKEKTYGYVTHVYFDGTLLRSPRATVASSACTGSVASGAGVTIGSATTGKLTIHLL
jgi:hypothetical protein